MEQTHGSQNLKAKGTLYLSGASNKPTAQPSIHLLPMLLVSPGPMASREDIQALPTTLVSPGKIFLACPSQPSPATYGIHAINRRDAKGLRLGPAQAAAQGT